MEIDDSFSFWKNLFLITVFVTVTPITILASLFSLVSLNQTKAVANTNNITSVESYSHSGVRVFASLPSSIPTVLGAATSADARPEIIKQYLIRYQSPLVPYANYIVEISDKYGLDYRLIPAIAQQESNLCKIIPPGGHNCWGWGIHSKGTLGFDSFEEAIETVSKGIREEYLNKGYTTVELIMSKYTPMSNGSWARGVNQFMSEME